MNNIAEGFERKTPTEFCRFLDIAKASCGEVRSMYYVAEDLSYTSPEVAVERRDRLKHLSGGIARMVSHLQQRVVEKSKRPPTVAPSSE
jgi:four helix bundle protein